MHLVQSTKDYIEHRTLKQLELVYLTLYLAVGIHNGESGENTLFVSFKTLCKTLDFGKSTLSNLLFSLLYSMSFASAHNLSKGLDQSMECRKLGADLTQLQEISTFVCVQIIIGGVVFIKRLYHSVQLYR